MNTPTDKPAYSAEHFDYSDLEESNFGRLLKENKADLHKFGNSIRVLSEESAEAVWTRTFGPILNKASIDKSNWTSQLSWKSEGNWLPFYNESSASPVEQQLRSLVEWPEEQDILFIKGPIDCIHANWGAFLHHWMVFIEYDDDGPFLIPLQGESVLRISPIGTILKGVAFTR